MDDATTAHRAEVKAAVIRALSAGIKETAEICAAAGGADVRLVEELRQEILSARSEPVVPDAKKVLQLEADARRRTAALPLYLPAADPLASQWWFTLDSIVSLSARAFELSAGGPVAFLGAPTVGYHFAERFPTVRSVVLDIDADVVRCLQDVSTSTLFTVTQYNAFDKVPAEYSGKYAMAVIDPPWYPDAIRMFVSRARDLLGDSGFILCVLPPRLTRPGIIEERTKLLGELLQAGFEVVALESQAVRYTVPEFEAAAYADLESFAGRPWRPGDILVLRVGRTSLRPPETQRIPAALAFSRDAHEFRIFLLPERAEPDLKELFVPVPEFEREVSTRKFPLEKIALWASNRRAARLKDPRLAKTILEGWQSGNTKEALERELVANGLEANQASRTLQFFNEQFLLCAKPARPVHRRNPENLRQIRETVLSSNLASQPSKRTYDFQNDQFRIDFQRDRDRVLWSHSLKRLADKTQVFSSESDEHLRRRLSHSIEVMQLSSTIAIAFGLDRELTEAGALAHDLGHTPFGHAGEFALDRILSDIAPRLGGFSHYEHGVDVVRWLEDVYSSPAAGGFPGLNLTPETVECIFKHTYHRGNETIGQRTLFQKSKHKDLQDNFCHLEGQAVRIADKLSYLISDLEDGIRMGVFTHDHLYACRLFYRAPVDLTPAKDETLYERFISQRRALLQVLMEDILVETDRRLATVGTRAAVRNASDYTVTYSREVAREVTEVWKRLQAGILHKDGRVIAANRRAASVVTELFLLYALSPELVDPHFRRTHQRLWDSDYLRHYKDALRAARVGVPKRMITPLFLERMIGSPLEAEGDNWMVPLEQIVMAKDYVASLTDTQARRAHGTLLLGGGLR